MRVSGKPGSQKSAHFADGSESITGPIPDKKFEGHSNLKGAAESQQRQAKKSQDANAKAMNSVDYIENLQK
jgi:hypothetical protein